MTVPGALQNPSDFRGSRCLAAALSHGKCSTAAKPQSEAGTLKFPPTILILSHSNSRLIFKTGAYSEQTNKPLHSLNPAASGKVL